ncbi:Bug family tripartite tricarboxylate transporter substrate binding protein [Variovorax ureilyticus]|uniref:Bug family tripartite tricarboxylate transporter substrate binding protein n=1 Tax=Variovorax ureilyticus TaxID=1836198 RepID=UPI003D679D1D
MDPRNTRDKGRWARHLTRAATLAAAALFASHAFAQAYPNRAIKIMVPFSTGSATDTTARVLADRLAPRLGVPVIVDNKPGASGTIGSTAVARSAPDGYTLILTSSSTHSATPALFAKLAFDPTEDFIHIARVATIPMMLVVRGDAPAKTIPEMRAAARNKPLSFAYGSATSQIAGATFSAVAGVPSEGIPYKSQPPAVTDLLGGHVDYLFADLSVVTSFMQSGRLAGVALSAPRRSKEFPSVPTLGELGYKDFDLVVWVGLAAPKGTPANVVDRLSREVQAVLAEPATVAKLSQFGMDVAVNSPAEHRAFALSQRDIWTSRAKAAGIQPE